MRTRARRDHTLPACWITVTYACLVIQISLAHFCEVHGPTSILCTQLLPISCTTCYGGNTPPSSNSSKKSARSSGEFDAKSSDDKKDQAEKKEQAGNEDRKPDEMKDRKLDEKADQKAGERSNKKQDNKPDLDEPFPSPPASPQIRNGAHNPYFGHLQSAGNGKSVLSTGNPPPIRVTVSSYSGHDACDNCAFLVPKDITEQLPEGAPGSLTIGGSGFNGSPVLRTMRVLVVPGAPDSEDEEETFKIKDAGKAYATSAKRVAGNAVDSAMSSPTHAAAAVHEHILTFVTTRQTMSQRAYTQLRRSCIRTLSMETLPRGASSGPMCFGDKVDGYTIAYVFRLPDPRARGRRRTYALIALGGRKASMVSHAMVSITKVFESIANQIVAMAEQMLERESVSQVNSRPSTAGPVSPPPMSSSVPRDSVGTNKENQNQAVLVSPEKPKAKSTANSPTSSTRTLSDVSSFLSAKKVDPDGYPRFNRDVMRAKGLTEIVGKESFFMELHAHFCRLLSELSSVLDVDSGALARSPSY